MSEDAWYYATDDRHAYGDMQPYLYRTGDYGRTWQRLVGPGDDDSAPVAESIVTPTSSLSIGTGTDQTDQSQAPDMGPVESSGD